MRCRSTLATITAITAVALMAAGGFGCGKKGSGVAKEEEREVEPFERIRIEGALKLDARLGPEHKVTVRGDDNLIEMIETRTDGDTLVISTEGSYRTTVGLSATVVAPSLTELKVSGATKGDVSGIEAKSFRLEVSGAAKVVLSGKTESLRIEVSGAGKVDAEKLTAAEVEVNLEGAAKVSVHADRKLDAKVSGVGKVSYSGEAKVTTKIDGIGKVTRR